MAVGPIVCDVAGTSLTAQEIERIWNPLVGMVILFTRNYESPEQLAALTKAIHDVKPGVLVSVDHEGGRVQRFRSGFTAIPAMGDLGCVYQINREAGERAAAAAGYILASELRACGVDFSFAPVLDLDYGRSTIIGARSYGRDPAQVADLARAQIGGMGAAGMAACGKHFPGHGWVQADSHVALPVDERPLAALNVDDLRPYEWLSITLPSIMTAHVHYQEVDAEPASFSKKLITEVLRHRLGYTGFVFSDDLSMQGAKSEGSLVVRAQKALEAGCDGLIICNSPAEVDAFLPAMTWWEPSDAFASRFARLAPRGQAAKDLAVLHADDVYMKAQDDLAAGLALVSATQGT